MTLSTSATSSVVVDASVLIDALLVGIDAVAVRTVDADLHAPVTIDAEFLHAMRRRWLGSLNFPIITRDRRLARSSGHAARIEYIA